MFAFERLHLLGYNCTVSVMVSNGSIKSLYREQTRALVKYILFRLSGLSGNADDAACLSDRPCTAHSLYSCVVQIGL